jgi:hypothetical protein
VADGHGGRNRPDTSDSNVADYYEGSRMEDHVGDGHPRNKPSETVRTEINQRSSRRESQVTDDPERNMQQLVANSLAAIQEDDVDFRIDDAENIHPPPADATTADDLSTTIRQMPTDQTIRAVEKCKMCRERIYPHNDRFKCTECRRSYHKQEDCSGLTIKQGKNLDRSTWRCEDCIEREAERNKPRPPDEEAIIYQLKTSKDESKQAEPIKILQWNTDNIKTKIVELRTLLEKTKVDIFVIQETKLIISDKTPTIPGYTIIRKDRWQSKGSKYNRGGGMLLGLKNNTPYTGVRLDM